MVRYKNSSEKMSWKTIIMSLVYAIEGLAGAIYQMNRIRMGTEPRPSRNEKINPNYKTCHYAGIKWRARQDSNPHVSS